MLKMIIHSLPFRMKSMFGCHALPSIIKQHFVHTVGLNCTVLFIRSSFPARVRGAADSFRYFDTSEIISFVTSHLLGISGAFPGKKSLTFLEPRIFSF